MPPRIPTHEDHDLAPDVQAVIDASALPAGPLHLFLTLARNEAILTTYFPFLCALLSPSGLPPRDRELVILTISRLCESAYEWVHHVRIGTDVGLTLDEVTRLATGDSGWPPLETALIGATEQLVTTRAVRDETWTVLACHYDDAQLIELVVLVGHYVMVATVLDALRIEVEPFALDVLRERGISESFQPTRDARDAERIRSSDEARHLPHP